MSTRKSPKHHHGISEEGEFSRVLHTIEKNLKPIFIGLGVILVIIFVVFVIIHQRREREEEAHFAFQTVFEDFRAHERDIYNWQQDEENEALLQEYIERYSDVYEEHSGTTFGREALFQQGRLKVLYEKYEEALSSFEEYQQNSQNDFEKARGLNGMGKAYESLAVRDNDSDRYLDAVEQYEVTIEQYSDLTPFYWKALLNTGTCYIYLNEYDQAEDYFQTLLGYQTEDTRNVPIFDEAQDRLEEATRRRAMN